jgi:hypothetical protein
VSAVQFLFPFLASISPPFTHLEQSTYLQPHLLRSTRLRNVPCSKKLLDFSVQLSLFLWVRTWHVLTELQWQLDKAFSKSNRIFCRNPATWTNLIDCSKQRGCCKAKETHCQQSLYVVLIRYAIILCLIHLKLQAMQHKSVLSSRFVIRIFSTGILTNYVII